MAKETRNTPIPELGAEKQVSTLADSVLYTPTPNMRKLKAKFWSRYTPGPAQDITTLTLADISEILGDTKVQAQWATPGLREWFLNRDENREHLEYLFTKWMLRAEQELDNENLQASAFVNLGKVLGELANKFPSKWQQERFTDDEINKMNQAQLREWLTRKGVTMTPLNQADVIESEVVYHVETKDESK